MPSCVGKLQALLYVMKHTLGRAMRRSLDVLPPVFPYKVILPALLARLAPVGSPLHPRPQGMANYKELRVKPELKKNYRKVWKWKKESLYLFH